MHVENSLWMVLQKTPDISVMGIIIITMYVLAVMIMSVTMISLMTVIKFYISCNDAVINLLSWPEIMYR